MIEPAIAAGCDLEPGWRFSQDQISLLAARYNGNDTLPLAAGGQARERGYYRVEEFVTVCDWASSAHRRYQLNRYQSVERRTQVALHTQTDKTAMTALLPLTGVSWTTASALLHFAHPRPFPILAVGRLLSLNYSPGTRFTLSLWLAYVHTAALSP